MVKLQKKRDDKRHTQLLYMQHMTIETSIETLHSILGTKILPRPQ